MRHDQATSHSASNDNDARMAKEKAGLAATTVPKGVSDGHRDHTTFAFSYMVEKFASVQLQCKIEVYISKTRLVFTFSFATKATERGILSSLWGERRFRTFEDEGEA